MKAEFKVLFDVTIYHDFYNDGLSKDFNIAPTSECSRLMRNNSLLFKENDNGFKVLQEIEDIKPEDTGQPIGTEHKKQPVRKINSDLEFTFELRSKKPELLNYTELSLSSPQNEIYCFSNLDSGGIERATLHNSTFAGNDELITLRPLSFGYLIESANSTATFIIHDAAGNEIIKYPAILKDGQYKYYIEKGILKTGVYKLYVDGIFKHSFFADDTVYKNKSFGVISILKNNDDVKQYSIKLGRRKTLWRYYVGLKYKSSTEPSTLSIDILKQITDDLGISVPAKHIKNETLEPRVSIDPDTQTTKNNIAVVSFVFAFGLPLSETPIKDIRLVTTNSNSGDDYGIPIIDNLPNPSIAMITPDTSANKVYSDMYVYI